MKKTISNLIFLNVMFVVGMTMANILAPRLVQLPFGLIVPAGTECFAITFLVTDVIGEIWGKTEARRTVIIGLISQLVVVVLMKFGLYVWKSVDTEFSSLMARVLSSNSSVVFGGIITYICSQFLDVNLFHNIRDFFIKKYGDNFYKWRWVWNNGSSFCSQLIDAFVFTFVTFGILLGGLKDGVSELIIISLSLYAYKLILAALDTPIFIYLTKNYRTVKNED